MQPSFLIPNPRNPWRREAVTILDQKKKKTPQGLLGALWCKWLTERHKKCKDEWSGWTRRTSLPSTPSSHQSWGVTSGFYDNITETMCMSDRRKPGPSVMGESGITVRVGAVKLSWIRLLKKLTVQQESCLSTAGHNDSEFWLPLFEKPIQSSATEFQSLLFLKNLRKHLFNQVISVQTSSLHLTGSFIATVCSPSCYI